MKARIKICGLTRRVDLLAAVRAGADAIGLVFYAPSPRYVDLSTAADLARAVPPLITVVGLFVNADPQDVTSFCVHGVIVNVPACCQTCTPVNFSKQSSSKHPATAPLTPE